MQLQMSQIQTCKRLAIIVVAAVALVLLVAIKSEEFHHAAQQTREKLIQLQSDTFDGGSDVTEAVTPESVTDAASLDDGFSFSSVMAWLNRSEGLHETYLLSAFWDARWEEVSDPFISALVFMRLAEHLPDSVQMYCAITCGERDPEPRFVPANMTDIKKRTPYRGKEYDGEYYLRIIIPCRPPTDCPHPDRVTLTYEEQSLTYLDDANSVAVEYPEPEMSHEFGICVPPIFGCLNPFHVVEWMEMQKILGVSKVVIHNNSQCEETSAVFEEYGRQGLVEIRQDRTILECDPNKTKGGWKMPMWRVELFLRDPLMLTDCMYRHMHDTKHLFFVDLDEVLVPERADTLHEMVKQVEKAYPLNGSEEYQQMTFSNFFFLMDDMLLPRPADSRYPRYTSYLQHRSRLGPSPINGRRKSLVRPTHCEYVHNHICPAPIGNLKPEAPPHEHLYVDAEHAKVHHYRSSPCGVRGNGDVTCQGQVASKPVIKDHTMLRFKDQLMTNVKKQLKLMGL